MGAAEPQMLAHQLALLIDGAIVAAMAPTPDGFDGNVASNETVTVCGYPAPSADYLTGLPGV